MDELLYVTTPYRTDDDDDGYESNPTEDWTEECNATSAFLDYHCLWEHVMTELVSMTPPIPAHNTNSRRPTTLLDRHGRSLPPLVLDLERVSVTPAVTAHDINCRRSLLPQFRD
ncbi:hypothetical protein LSAT2_025844, partial [Lamellibrachia satsuma]